MFEQLDKVEWHAIADGLGEPAAIQPAEQALGAFEQLAPESEVAIEQCLPESTPNGAGILRQALDRTRSRQA
jgi:hypothetical protein